MNKNLERDIILLALINKAMDVNTINMNSSKDARYSSIGTLLFNIKQTLEDGMRVEYVDEPLMEVDSSKFTDVKQTTDSDSDEEEKDD